MPAVDQADARNAESRIVLGVPVGLAVEGANRNDMKMVGETLASIPVERPELTPGQPQGLCMEKGYDYDEVRQIVEQFGFTAHIKARGEEAKEIKRRAASRPGVGWWSGRTAG